MDLSVDRARSAPPDDDRDLQVSELSVLRALELLADRGRSWNTAATIATAAHLQLCSAGDALRRLRQRELAQARQGRWSIDRSGFPHLSAHDLALVAGGAS